jgi:hypothetical protein
MMADSTSILAILLLAVPFATMQAKPSQKAFWPKILFEIAPQLFRAAALGDRDELWRAISKKSREIRPRLKTHKADFPAVFDPSTTRSLYVYLPTGLISLPT